MTINNSTKYAVQGILLLDKPLHLSSNAALQKVKRLFSAKKAGHTGSLDPLATGMLPLCFGGATKFSQFLLNSDKEYRVTMTLGIKTTTGDAEGEIISTRSIPPITLESIQKILEGLTGAVQQIPPMYSALKHQGKPLYQLARQGIEIEREARTIQIYGYTHIQFTLDTISFDVRCSKGTYVRTLVEDIGERLGCGAHVTQLRRLSVAPYEDVRMYSLDELMTIHEQEGVRGLYDLLLPAETSVQALPDIQLSTSAAFYLRTGQSVMVSSSSAKGFVRIFNDEKFLGIGEISNDGRLMPRRLM